MIHFELNKGGYKIELEKFLKELEKIVFKEFKKSGIISVAFVSGAKIREYNKRYRRKNKATDILTFVLNEKNCLPRTFPPVGEKMRDLGEIVLSLADVKKRAGKSKKSVMETAVYLITHGVCHIFGLTHKGENDTRKMEAKEKKITGFL